jgi:iron complex outermembrane receptor protein
MLPFIPADKLTNDIIFLFNHTITLKTGADIVFAQRHPGDFESATSQYWLLHSSMICRLPGKKHPVTLTVAGDNLLNKTYYDHLSRFKYFNIYNAGRNVMITISVPVPNKQAT